MIVASAMALSACGGSDSADSSERDTGDVVTEDLIVDDAEVAEALADLDTSEFAGVELTDRRPAILSELGAPDSFVIEVDEIDGVVSRFESWSYYDAQTQIDFVDGELLWNLEMGSLPDGSWLPLGYSPLEFEMMASTEATLALLSDVELIQVDATDMEVEGAEMWAGEQLLLVFVDDRLVMVETYPLSADQPEVIE